jgi:hypothetical protein|tara:strand:+ start:42 stop:383 length:342 start_codon:yes stop_codon:yes gene_type:complete
MSEQKLDKEFEKLQSDWQKALTKFMNRSDKLNDAYQEGTPPGMTETMLFGLMWYVIKDRLKKYTLKHSDMDAELEFVRAMMKKILNEDYPNSLFAKEDGKLIPVQTDKKITIN